MDNQINQINQTNSQGQQHGLWEYYYSNGKLGSKGYCKNNKKIGPWKTSW